MNNITKKAYVKPDIALVDFSLASSIAAACKYTAEFAENECTYTDNEMVLFTSKINGCEWKTDEFEFDICYHVPQNDETIFGSYG